MTLKIYNGQTLRSIDDTQAFLAGEDLPGEQTGDEYTYYATVPWLFRAVNARADGVGSMPWVLMNGKQDVTQSSEYNYITNLLPALLKRFEASRCLCAASYALIESNRGGYGKPRWVVPSTMDYEADEVKGLTGFTRTINGRPIPLKLNQVLYSWIDPLDAEVGPGVAPASVALKAAGVLGATDNMILAYFARGAIKVTAFSAPGNPDDEEKKRVQSKLRKLLSGIRHAFEVIVISETLKPVQIGSDLKDTEAPEVIESKRADVAVALGTPESIIWGASAYATAHEADQAIFLENTIIPEALMITNDFNAQWLQPLGLSLEIQPKKHPAMRQKFMISMMAAKDLTDKPPLDVDEWRAMFDLPPKAKEEPPAPPPVAPVVSAEQVAVDAQAAQEAEQKKWREYAVKRLREGHPEKMVNFEAHAIPIERVMSIKAGLKLAATEDEVKAIFSGDDYADLRLMFMQAMTRFNEALHGQVENANQ